MGALELSSSQMYKFKVLVATSCLAQSSGAAQTSGVPSTHDQQLSNLVRTMCTVKCEMLTPTPMWTLQLPQTHKRSYLYVDLGGYISFSVLLYIHDLPRMRVGKCVSVYLSVLAVTIKQVNVETSFLVQWSIRTMCTLNMSTKIIR